MEISIEMVVFVVSLVIQAVGAAFLYGKLTQKLDGLANDTEKNNAASQKSIDGIWSSVMEIIKDYLTKDDAEKFYEIKKKD